MVDLQDSLQSLSKVLFGSIINKNIDLFKYRSLKLAINYLLDNCCFTLGSMCFHKLIGITMAGPRKC